MRAAFAAIAQCLLATLLRAQSSQDFEKEVECGVADMSKSRLEQLMELTMFSDLLHDAPLDAPHELARAIMSP